MSSAGEGVLFGMFVIEEKGVYNISTTGWVLFIVFRCPLQKLLLDLDGGG